MSWKLPHGKFLAVTGASGAGKSSFLACLSGIVAPANGGFSLSAAEEKNVGFIFQNFRLTKNLSVLTNVLCGRLGAYNWRQTFFSFDESEKSNAFAILRELGLEKLIYRKVRQISGGEQQRTAVARALLQNAEIILADEPTSNLDNDLAKKVLGLLRRKCEAENRAAVVVLHDARLVAEYADYELEIGAEHENGWNFRAVR